MPSPFEAIAVVSPGLETVAAAELTALGAEAVQPLHRAVACRCDQITFQRLHLQARLPFRLLRQLARFPCHSRDELRPQLPRAADWALWLPPEALHSGAHRLRSPLVATVLRDYLAGQRFPLQLLQEVA